jgi:glutathione S-transferase
MEIELYYTPHTRSLRPRWLLEELEIPYTIHPVDLFGGERNPTHPLGSVPSMRVDGEWMIESGAMCHWLALAGRPLSRNRAGTDSRQRTAARL